MYLTPGIFLLNKTIEIENLLYSQCTVGGPVCSTKAYK